MSGDDTLEDAAFIGEEEINNEQNWDWGAEGEDDFDEVGEDFRSGQDSFRPFFGTDSASSAQEAFKADKELYGFDFQAVRASLSKTYCL